MASSLVNSWLALQILAFVTIISAARVPVSNNLDMNPCGPIPLIANAKLYVVMKPPVINENGTGLSALRQRIAQLTYKCNTGFVLQGNPEVSCNEEYLLFSEFPTCVPNKTCGPAPEIDDGEIVVQTFTGSSGYGDQVTYECSKAFLMNGDPMITCQINGNWTAIPNCGTPAITGCGPPPYFRFQTFIDKSYTNPKKTVQNDYVAFGCELGYLLTNGTSVMRCNGTHWLPNAVPECVRWPETGCGPVPWIEHTKIEERSFPNGSSRASDYVVYTCDPGYVTRDDFVVSCLENGRWSALPECRKVVSCDYPPIMRHGRVYTKYNTTYPIVGSNVTYICFNNYKMVGNATIFCKENLSWTQAPKCEEIANFFCPPITPVQNANIEAATYLAGVSAKPGDSVVFRCLDNYRMIGPKMARCLISLRWSSRPLCLPIAPPPSLHLIKENSAQDDILTTTTPSPSSLFCNKPPSFPNAIIVAQSFGPAPKSGDMVVYQCDDGYEKAKGFSSSLLCVKNTWLGLVKCNLRNDACSPPLNVKNADILARSFSGNRGIPKDTITYECRPGFMPVNTRGVSTANDVTKIASRCEDGRWVNLPVCISRDLIASRKNCQYDPPDLRKATVIGTGYSGMTNSFSTGDYAVYQCLQNMTLTSTLPNTVYTIESDDRIPPPIMAVECLANGSWSDTPICTPVADKPTTCGHIPPLAQNIIVITAEGVVGSPPTQNYFSRINDYLQLDCKPGFELNGTDRVVCQEDGTWSKSPNCIAVTCGLMPTAPDHAMVLFQSFKEMSAVDDFVLYKCRSGYRLVNGTDRIKCEISGNWSRPFPVCQRIIPQRIAPIPAVVCDPGIPIPKDASIIYSSFGGDDDPFGLPKVGDFVIFGCPPGYSVMGNTTIMCQLGGTWTKPNPCTVGGVGGEYSGGKLHGSQCLKGTTDLQHTSCLDDSYALRSLRPLNVQEILDLHNFFRMNVTPPARNMKNLTWDDELAITAERWAAQCTTSNDDGRHRLILQKGWRWVGQNIFASASEFTAPQAIASWADERRYWSYGVGSTDPTQVVGHYTQIIWAQTLYMGCGMAVCDQTGNPLANIIVCNYAPGGNTAYVGQNPYAAPYELRPPGRT